VPAVMVIVPTLLMMLIVIIMAVVLIMLIVVSIIATSGTTDGLKLLVSQFYFGKGVSLYVIVCHLYISSLCSCCINY
jgi:hypothetical protein